MLVNKGTVEWMSTSMATSKHAPASSSPSALRSAGERLGGRHPAVVLDDHARVSMSCKSRRCWHSIRSLRFIAPTQEQWMRDGWVSRRARSGPSSRPHPPARGLSAYDAYLEWLLTTLRSCSVGQREPTGCWASVQVIVGDVVGLRCLWPQHRAGGRKASGRRSEFEDGSVKPNCRR